MKVGYNNSKIIVLTDEEETDPTQEFNALGNTIASIIKDSPPRFTLGIYGEWGTGKSTLMKLIENKLKTNDNSRDQKILHIWFNAWKFEREEQFAAIALLKTIAYKMTGQDKLDSLSKTIRKSLKILGKDLLQKIATGALLNEKGVEAAENSLNRNMEFLEKIDGLDKDTIYFDGLESIRIKIEEIRRANPEFRLVVYIDDLDRCSPKMALEVLESIKVFLDMEGFVYVIGVSHTTVSKLISQAYKDTGIDGVEYIKKIIQIPIKLPEWSQEDAKIILNQKIIPKLSSKYQKIFSEGNAQTLISELEQNPRRIKRLVNNLMIAHETFSLEKDNELDLTALFLFSILKKRWPLVFQYYVKSSDNFKNLVIDCDDICRADHFKEYEDALKFNPSEQADQIKTRWEVALKQYDLRSNLAHILELDREGVHFIDSYGEKLNEIKDWNLYGLAIDIIEEVDSQHIPKIPL